MAKTQLDADESKSVGDRRTPACARDAAGGGKAEEIKRISVPGGAASVTLFHPRAARVSNKMEISQRKSSLHFRDQKRGEEPSMARLLVQGNSCDVLVGQ